ncbi:MAG: hypothetical protein FJY35_04090 [Betaproteobacteria bacterium]|nr:hypothetical protein [Betaproteobacteria bacterium]
MIFELNQSDDVSEFLDFESIQQQSADQVAVEELQDFAEPKTTSKGLSYRSVRVYAVFDLRAMRRKVVRKIACSDPMGGGEVVLRDEKESDWEPVDPGSPHYEKVKALRQAEKLGFW